MLRRRPTTLYSTLALMLLPGLCLAQAPNTWRVPGAVGDGFATSLDTGHDLDGDGVGDILVGLPDQHVGGTFQAGRAEVRSGANPSVTLLVVGGEIEDGRFGQSVAWLGDLNDDDVPDFAVGAPGATADAATTDAYVSILSGVDGTEIRRLSPLGKRLYDGGFEGVPGVVDAPWTATSGSVRTTTSVPGMPVAGAAYLSVSGIGSTDAIPPSNPGGVGDLPVGARSAVLEFQHTRDHAVLQGTVVFASPEPAVLETQNDFISIDVSAGGIHRNAFFLDVNTATFTTSETISYTDALEFSLDLADAFPASDTDTTFTLTLSCGNAEDSLFDSSLLIDELALTDAVTMPTAGPATEMLGNWFGWSIANLGDLSGDGLPELAVGAPGSAHASSSAAAGSAYVFSCADGSLLRTVDGGNGDSQFGSNVSAAGDVNDDDTPDWIVGSTGTDAVGGALISGDDNEVLDRFSTGTVATVSQGVDLDGDGLPDWISGESADNQLRLLDSSGDPLFGPPMDPVISGDLPGDLGSAVKIVGDVDGDGILDFAAGSPGAVADPEVGGLVVVYSGRTSRELFSAFGDDTNESFGATLGAPGDSNLDGFADVLVGDPGANGGSGELQLIFGGNPWHAAPGLRLDMPLAAAETHSMLITAGLDEVLMVRAKPGKKSALQPQIRVIGPLPAETEVLAAADSASSTKLAKAKVELPTGGDYRIEILDATGAGGTYAFTSSSKAAKVKDLLTAAGPDDDDLVLPLGKVRAQGELEAGATSRATFTARAGTVVSLQVITDKADSVIPGLRLLHVVDATEVEIVSTADSVFTTSKAQIKSLELPAHGQYIVEVSSLVDAAGAFELRSSAKLPKEKRKLTAPEPLTLD